ARAGRAAGARRRLDDVGDVALAGLLVEVLELLAGVLRVLGEIEVAAVGDALELLPADGVQVLAVRRRARVGPPLFLRVRARGEVVAADAEPLVPVHPRLEPVQVPA